MKSMKPIKPMMRPYNALVIALGLLSVVLTARADALAEEGTGWDFGLTGGLLGGVQPTFGLFAERSLSTRFDFRPFLLFQPHFGIQGDQSPFYLSTFLGFDLSYRPQTLLGLRLGLRTGVEYCTLSGCTISPFVGPAVAYDFKITDSVTLSPEFSVLFNPMNSVYDKGGLLLNVKGLW